MRSIDRKRLKSEDAVVKKPVVNAWTRLASTEDGQRVLRDIMMFTGYEDSCTSKTDSLEVSLINTALRSARRDLWLNIRQHIPHDKLHLIECEKPLGVKHE